MACFLSLKESKTQRKSVYKKINQRNGAHFSLWSSKQIILFTFLLDKMKLLINLQQFLPDQHVEVSFYILCYVIIFASFSLSTFFFFPEVAWSAEKSFLGNPVISNPDRDYCAFAEEVSVRIWEQVTQSFDHTTKAEPNLYFQYYDIIIFMMYQ